MFLLWEIKNQYWKKLFCLFDFLFFQVNFLLIWSLLLHTSPVSVERMVLIVGTGGWNSALAICCDKTSICHLHLLPATCHHREELLDSEGNALLVKSRTNIAVTCNLLFTLQWSCTLHYESVILQYLDVALGLLPFSSKQAFLAKVRLINCEVVLCI